MFNRSTQKRIILMLAALLALTLCGQALAETMTVYAAVDGAKVYNEDGVVIGTIQANTMLTLTGMKSGICRVERDGFTAYMLKAELSGDAPAQNPFLPEATPQPTPQTGSKQVSAYVSAESATVYSAQAEALGALALNTPVTVTDMKGNVCQISYNGNTGYMLRDDLSATPAAAAATPDPTVTPAPAATAEPQMLGLNAYVIREGAAICDLNGTPLGTLALNTAVVVTGVKGDICRISYNSGEFYMRKGDLGSSPVTAAATAAPEATVAPEDGQLAQSVKGYVALDGAMVLNSSGKLMAVLPQNTEVMVQAVKKGVCMVTVGGQTGFMRIEDLSREKTPATSASADSVATAVSSTITPAKGTAQAMDWFSSDIQKIFAKGTVVQVTDVATGLSWRELRYGGDNHADCEPLTAMDTAVLKQVFGGEWSWDRRAVFVTINGVNYAAAINGMPHDGSTIADNNFEGHHCIHFVNSRTHGTNEVDAKSQEAIQKAASTTL